MLNKLVLTCLTSSSSGSVKDGFGAVCKQRVARKAYTTPVFLCDTALSVFNRYAPPHSLAP